MTSISQGLPSFSSGISEQPDQLKFPGQVKNIINGIPDITYGLYKRPGSARIGTTKLTSVSASHGSWFHYYRDEKEGAYVGQIADDGRVRIWSCNDGEQKIVWYNAQDQGTINNSEGNSNYKSNLGGGATTGHDAILNYLKKQYSGSFSRSGTTVTLVADSAHGLSEGDIIYFNGPGTPADGNYTITQIDNTTTFKFTTTSSGTIGSQSCIYLNPNTSEEVQALSINDTTFLANRTRTITSTGTTPGKPHPYAAYLEFKRTENGRQYGLNLSTPTADPDETITRATLLKIKADTLEESAGTAACPGIGTQVFAISNPFLIGGIYYHVPTTSVAHIPFPKFYAKSGDNVRKYHPKKKLTLLVGDDKIMYNDDNIGSDESHWLSGGNYGGVAGGARWLLSNGSVNLVSAAIGTTYNDGGGYNNSAWTDAAPLVTALQGGTGYAGLNFTITYDGLKIFLNAKNDDTSLNGTWTLKRCNADGTLRPDQTAVEEYITGTAIVDGEYVSPYYTTITPDATRKNLIFRLTTLGQVGQATSGATINSYSCTYNREITLLHGGEGWTLDNQVVVEMDTPKTTYNYTIGIEDIETSTITADLKIVRPTPTPFDADTAVTIDTIIGGVLGELTNINSFTIATGDVNTGTEVITINSHGLLTGQAYRYKNNSGTTLAGLTDDTVYFIIKVDANTIKLATTAANAEAGTAINLTGTGNSNQTLEFALETTTIGNGIYLSSQSAFNVEIIEPDLMRVMQDTINDVTELPTQCKHGYIVKVANSRMSDEDDHYLKFQGTNNASSSGSWEECAEPGIALGFEATSMPHILQRQADGTFLVKKYTWQDRVVGDTTTNPMPSFVDNKLNKILFHRNRLAFLCNDNVILSQPGNLGTPNFFNETALIVSNNDPIDIACSSTFPSELFDGIEINAGLLIFSSNQQFLLTSDAEVLNPDTAKLGSLATYNYNTNLPPISLGTTIAYIDNSGKYSRLNEMANSGREAEPTVIEVSKLVPTLLPKDLDLITNSRENGIIILGKTNTDIVYGFRYFNLADQRKQSAWFKWKLNNPVKYHFIIDDIYYFIDTDNFLQKINIIQTEEDLDIDEEGVNYPIHLDNWTTVGSGSYNAGTGLTTFTNQSDWIDDITSPNGTLALYDDDQADARRGNYAHCTVINGDDFTVPGDWSGITVKIGYVYDYQVELPRIYVKKQAGEQVIADVNASLVLHRVKLSFGKVGHYETTLTRLGKPTYTELCESAVTNAYNVSDAPYVDEQIKIIPVYDKNENVDITLKSSHPSPATLHSLSWEGDYTPKYYKRV